MIVRFVKFLQEDFNITTVIVEKQLKELLPVISNVALVLSGGGTAHSTDSIREEEAITATVEKFQNAVEGLYSHGNMKEFCEVL